MDKPLGKSSIPIADVRGAYTMAVAELACGNRLERKDPSFDFPNTGDPEGNIPAPWYHHSQMADMFKLTDVVVIVLPSTPDTRQLVGQSELEALPEHALVINVGRGSVMVPHIASYTSDQLVLASDMLIENLSRRDIQADYPDRYRCGHVWIGRVRLFSRYAPRASAH